MISRRAMRLKAATTRLALPARKLRRQAHGPAHDVQRSRGDLARVGVGVDPLRSAGREPSGLATVVEVERAKAVVGLGGGSDVGITGSVRNRA